MDGLILILFYVSRSSEASAGNSGGEYVFNYTSARRIDRPQTQDIIQQVRADLPSRDSQSAWHAYMFRCSIRSSN